MRAQRASSAATAISFAFSSASCLMNCTICGAWEAQRARASARQCSKGEKRAEREARVLRDSDAGARAPA
jgi:pyruvate-formate lyase-activating enzyme